METFPRNLPRFIDSTTHLWKDTSADWNVLSDGSWRVAVKNGQNLETHVGGSDPDVGVVENGRDELILQER